MSDIIWATGGPQYNVLKRLEARGFRIRKLKDGGSTRYFAMAPATESFEAAVTSKGQVTIPKEVRERMHLRVGDKVRFVVEDGNRTVIVPAGHSIRDLFGILGKPPRGATLTEMDDAIAQGAVERYLKSKP